MRRTAVLSAFLRSALVLGWCSMAAGATLPLVRTFPTPNQWQNGLTFVGDDLWLWDVGVPNTFYVLDPSDGHVRATYPAPETWGGAGLAYDGQFLWGCAGGTELRLFVKMDPRDGSVIQSYPLPVPEPTGLTFDGTNLWVSQIDGYSIAEVDPETGSVIRTIEKEPYFSFDLAWDERAMWLTAFERGDPYQYYLYRIDPLTGATLAMYDGPSGGPTGIAIKDGLIYVASWWDNQIYVYAVPEPASLALGALGSMLVVRKRRRAAPERAHRADRGMEVRMESFRRSFALVQRGGVQMRTRGLLLSLFWVSMVCSSAVGEYIAYEGDAFPEDEGWSVVGTLPAPDQYTRSISGGAYTISAVADSHTKVIYEREISFACDNVFYEWRSRTSNNDGYGGAGMLFGQPGARSLVAVSWHADYGRVYFHPVAGEGYIWEEFSLVTGAFHTFRVEGNGADYAFFVDGNPVLASALQSPGTENAFFSWNFTKQYINVPTDSDWDYVRSGEIPEPVTLLLFSGAFALMVRRRQTAAVTRADVHARTESTAGACQPRRLRSMMIGGLACFVGVLAGNSTATGDCSGIMVKRTVGTEELLQSYPPGPGCHDLYNEVTVGSQGVTFWDDAVAYDDQDNSTVYYIYVNYQTPVTVRMGEGSNPQNKNIAIALRYGLGSSSYVPFSSVDVDLSDCAASHLLTSYVGSSSGTGCNVTKMKVNGSCSLWVKGNLTGPLVCDTLNQTVIIRKLTSTGSITVNGNIADDLSIAQETGYHWGPQSCDGDIVCHGALTSPAMIKIRGTLSSYASITITGASASSGTIQVYDGSWCPVYGDVSIENFTGNICAGNINAGNVLSILPDIEPGCTGGTFYGSWTCCGQTPTTCPDTTPPTISISSPSASSVCAGGGPVNYTVTYTDANLAAVTLNTGHVTLNTTGDASGTVSVLGSGSDSPATRTVAISNITGTGTIGISIAAGTARDASNNYAPAAGPSTPFTVQPATAITTHPAGDSVALGDTAIFGFAATGAGTLSYQWQKDESNLSDGGHYSGATTDTLTVSDATWDDAASYRCIVAGNCGSAVSNAATLTVTCHDPRQDAEGDGDVDLSDFAVFAQCFNGPNRAYADPRAECLCFDNEADDDVDLSDFFVFASCFNGPNRVPAAGCSSGGFAMEGMSEGDGPLDSVDVTFALDSDQDQQTISAGTDVDWVASVEVTGSNQGLATFGFDIELHEGSATGPLADITIGTGTWADSFAVAGPDGQPETGAAVTASGSAGGPGMNALSSTGYNATPGLLEQVGAGYLSWDPWRLSGKSWTGNSTWGVGLDARREALLLDALGSYSLATGTIDTTNLDPGDYVLRLVPAASPLVLESGIDLNAPASGSVSEPAGSVSEPVTIEFTISAE